MILMQMNLFGSMAMKKYILIAAMAAMAIVAGSCAKEQDSLVDKPASANQNLVKMHFTARTEGTPTKTTLNTSTGAVSWAAGDKIKMVWELDGEADFSFSDELSAGNISAGKAEFTAEVPDKFAMTEKKYIDAGGTSLHLYAVYPSSVVTDYSDASTFYLTVPNVQDGSFEHASIALAKWDKTNPSAPLVFKNLCGLLQIVIDDDDVRKIEVAGNGNIAGKVSVTFKDVTYPDDPIVKAVSEGSNTITVNVSGAGKYYVAVLPGDITNLSVALYNAGGSLIGDKYTNNTLSIARKQIRKLGTVATDAVARFFVKASGTGDGTSWDKAASFSSLQTKLCDNSTAKIYLSAEKFTVSSTTTVAAAKSSGNYQIYGGYPADATGCTLAGRAIGGTILDGDGSVRGFNIGAGTYSFDGITFNNFKSSGASGAVIIVSGATVLKCSNCVFGSNVAGINGGAVHFNGSTGSAVFTNCVFSDNSATATSNNQGLGAAVGSAGSSGNPTIEFTKCLFSGNHSYNGGAIWTRRANIRLRDCSFIDNYADNESASNGVGGAIFSDGTNTLSIYLDKVYFSYSSKDKVGKQATVRVRNENASLGINNCTFAGSWGSSGIMQVSAYGNTVIANSTLFGRIATGGTPTLYGSVHNQGTMVIANCIIPNAASKGAGRSMTTYGTSLAVYNTLYSVLAGTSGTYTVENSLSGIKIFSDAGNTNFPENGVTTWYTGTDYSDNKTSSMAVNDCREAIHYYGWDGIIPDVIPGASSYTKITLSTLEGYVNSANSAFKEWLGSSLSVDIRGAARDTDAMWPGSYEGSTTKAGIESFSLK